MKKMNTDRKNSAIYPGTFDSITLGHIDIATRALDILDALGGENSELVVGHGNNDSKGNGLLNPYERLYVSREVLKEIAQSKQANVRVSNYSGSLDKFAFDEGARVLVRGIRNSKDLDDESALAFGMAKMSSRLRILHLLADPKFHNVSSSISKVLMNHGARLDEILPLNAKKYNEATGIQQYNYFVTGEIASGKSTITDKLIEIGKNKYHFPMIDDDLDKFGHDITNGKLGNGYETIRNEISRTFGDDVLDDSGMVIRKKLGAKVFGHPEELEKLNIIMKDPIREEMFRSKVGLPGLHLLNGALIMESGISQFTNNDGVLITVDKDIQKQRLKDRGHNDEEIERRVNSQFSGERKLEEYKQHKKRYHNYGTLHKLENNDASDEQVEDLLLKIAATVDVDGRLRAHSLLKRLKVIGLDEGNDLKHDLYEEVKARLFEKGRDYHNLFHIVDFLNNVYKYRKEFTLPLEVVETAVWVHDLFKGENHERKAAVLVRKLGKKYGWSREFIDDVTGLVMATDLKVEAKTPDQALFADLDRSVLARDEIDFDWYRNNARQEYLQYTDQEFIIVSIMFFENNVINKSAFQSDLGHHEFDAKAKENAIREVKRLKSLLKKIAG